MLEYLGVFFYYHVQTIDKHYYSSDCVNWCKQIYLLKSQFVKNARFIVEDMKLVDDVLHNCY